MVDILPALEGEAFSSILRNGRAGERLRTEYHITRIPW